jgi:AbrB family looped-hinge helix DNA binding protein
MTYPIVARTPRAFSDRGTPVTTAHFGLLPAAGLWNKDFILAIVRIEEPLRETDMAKITSKYQVTVPKTIAERYGIRPGDDIDWVAAGEVIRVIPPGQQVVSEDPESRLRLFDQATERHRGRSSPRKAQRSRVRGWRREDLYGRGRSR